MRSSDGGDRPVTDGPYAETVEHLGGLWIVDLPHLDTAVEVTRLLPAEYSLEVRPADGHQLIRRPPPKARAVA
ncbi:MAG: YciI family protein [Kineosporiaceae bacterium]